LDTFAPELVALEVRTPDARALHACRLIRAATTTPLLVLSDRCSERDSVAAFSAGADSVVTEPVGAHELVARARALMRRAPDLPEASDDLVVVGPIVLDRARREITVRDELVVVPRREFEIAELLMSEAGRVVTRARIVRDLWGAMRDTKSLDVQVGRLRARLSAASGRACIVTVRGVGFRFATADELEEEAPSGVVDIETAGDAPNDADLVAPS
jgi:two-component system response regulator RegX3